MRIVSYNAGNASNARVRDDYANLAALKPDVIGSQEVTDRASILEHVAGFDCIQRHDAPNSAHVALNVRQGATVTDVQLVTLNRRTWVGRLVAGARKSGKTKPKPLLSAVVDGIPAGVTHLVPSVTKRRNILARRVFRKQVAGCVDWFNRQGPDAVLVMDGNAPPSFPLFAPLRAVATPYAKGKSHGIDRDIVWVKGDAVVAIDALSGYSSDHPPEVADITWASQQKPAPTPAPKEPIVGKIKPPAPPYVGPAAHTSAGSNQPIRRIVIHSTVSACKAGGARATAAYFRNPASGGSAHYVVDPGEVVQVVWDDTIAWHAPPNQGSIGVELCDMPGTDSGHMAPVSRWRNKSHAAMLDRAADLVAQLCLAYDVPIRKIGPGQLKAGRHGICGHTDVSQAWHQSDHWDPGHFPWDAFIALVQEKADALTGKPSTPVPAPAPAPAPVVAKPAAPAKRVVTPQEQAARNVERGRAIKDTKRPKVRSWMKRAAAWLRRK